MVGAGEWQALENGSRWRMAVAGEWQSLENGSRWRLGVAGVAGDWEHWWGPRDPGTALQ